MKSNEIPEEDFCNPLKDLPGEEWVELIFPDTPYELSNYGRLKSYAKDENGLILYHKSHAKYIMYGIKVNKIRRNFCIHKLVATYFVPNADKNKKKVIHIDNDSRNNFYKNLKWVTGKECFAHAEKFNENLKKKFRNSKNSNAKISKEEAEKIRKMIEEGIKQSEIAKIFNISEMQITRIKRKENWIE